MTSRILGRSSRSLISLNPIGGVLSKCGAVEMGEIRAARRRLFADTCHRCVWYLRPGPGIWLGGCERDPEIAKGLERSGETMSKPTSQRRY